MIDLYSAVLSGDESDRNANFDAEEFSAAGLLLMLVSLSVQSRLNACSGPGLCWLSVTVNKCAGDVLPFPPLNRCGQNLRKWYSEPQIEHFMIFPVLSVGLRRCLPAPLLLCCPFLK